MLATLLASEDALRILLLIGVGGGLLALGRWSSRLAPPPVDAPTPDNKDLLTLADDEGTPKVWPPSAEEVAAGLPYDPRLGKLRIVKIFFDRADVSPGPEDPEVFADELHVELYDPDSSHYWWQSWFVATPGGLAKVLHDKGWRYLHAPQMLVLPRYDLEEIRRAVVSRIMADHDYYKGLEDKQEEEAL